MEQKLVKTALYGFLTGLALMLLFVPETREIPVSSGGTKIVNIDPFEYALRVLRYTIIFTIAVVMLMFAKEKRAKNFPDLPPVINMLFYIVLGFVSVSASGIVLVYFTRFILKLTDILTL